jgi:Group II intron, maturase-specific domain
MRRMQNTCRPRGLLEPCAWKAGMHGSEGAGAQRCVPATRRFHHRWVRSRGWRGERGVTFLARWPADKAMQRARDRIRELTARSRLLLSVETVVQDINRFLRGWAAYFRYGHSTARFGKIRSYALERLALLIRKRHKRGRGFGWRVVTRLSPNQCGLINLDGTVVAPRANRPWREKPNAGGERRR